MTTEPSEINPGDVRTRQQIKAVFGGSPQGGINPSVEHRCVNLYSENAGSEFGYVDGWLEEEDELGPIFEYTGHGQTGDQNFDRGNKAVRDHAEMGRVLRVFKQVGYVPGTGTGLHRYLGEFALDPVEPYVWRTIHDGNGEVGADGKQQETRNVIVFRLRPAGEVQHSPEDTAPVAPESAVEMVEHQPITTDLFDGGPSSQGNLPSRNNGKPRSGQRRYQPPHSETSSAVVESRDFATEMSIRAATAETIVRRQAAEVEAEYIKILQGAGHKTGAVQLKVKGLSTTFRVNLYDATDHTLYMVKRSNSRDGIYLALGQLLAYREYFAEAEGFGGVPPKCVVLLPSSPPRDMADLLERYDIGVVYRADDWSFVGDAVPEN